MNRVVRATDLLGQPVVTLSGDDLADVRDVVYNADEGRLVGFTLNKRSLFHGKLRQLLPMSAVRSIGRDAVMVDSDDALVDSGDAPPEIAEASPDRDVIGAVVLTSEGTQLGEVTDVIVSLGRRACAVGYELVASKLEQREQRPLFIPLPEQLSVSGDALIVPHEVDRFLRDDLSGFGAAVTEFRAQLGGPASEPAGAGAQASTEASMSKDELYAEAKRRHIPGRSKMTKPDLVRALSSDRGER